MVHACYFDPFIVDRIIALDWMQNRITVPTASGNVYFSIHDGARVIISTKVHVHQRIDSLLVYRKTAVGKLIFLRINVIFSTSNDFFSYTYRIISNILNAYAHSFWHLRLLEMAIFIKYCFKISTVPCTILHGGSIPSSKYVNVVIQQKWFSVRDMSIHESVI